MDLRDFTDYNNLSQMSLIQNISIFSLNARQSLWLLWLLLFFLFVIMSFIFSRQWKNYGIQNSNLRFAEFIYYILSIFLLGFAAISIILFNANL